MSKVVPLGRPLPAATEAGGSGAAPVVAGLALLYLRHGDAPRALALGIAAMRLARPEPRLVLLVAAAFLRTGEPEQTLAALTALEGSGRLASVPEPIERAAAAVLRAKALYRLGDPAGARRALAEAQPVAAAVVEAGA